MFFICSPFLPPEELNIIVFSYVKAVVCSIPAAYEIKIYARKSFTSIYNIALRWESKYFVF